MKNKLQYYLVISLIKLIMIVPRKLRHSFFKALGTLTYLVYSKNKRVIEQNLNYVYDGNISKEEIKKIQKSCYQKLFLNILSIIESGSYTPKEIEQMTVFEGKEYLDTQKPFIFITAHVGNLDMLGTILGHFFGKTVHIHQKIKNPLLNDYMTKQRERSGIKFVDKHGAVKKLFYALKNKEVVSLVIDQNTKKNIAIKTTFLGKKVYQTPTSTMLSRRFNIPIIPIFIVSEDEKYKVIIKEPIHPDGKSEDELHRLQADAMSEVILKYPQEWFWCHKRFKNSAPHIYKM